MRATGVRGANKELVLAELHDGASFTRSELANRTSLTPQALGPILAELVEEGLVEVTTAARSGPGRPATASTRLTCSWSRISGATRS